MFGSAEEMTLSTITACLNTRPHVETQTREFTSGFFCLLRVRRCSTDGSVFASGGLALLCTTVSDGDGSVFFVSAEDLWIFHSADEQSTGSQL